jgi:uncharacterized membrane protein
MTVRAAAAATAVFLLCMPAQAALNLCNRTSYVIYAATAAQTASDITVKGWTRLVPGSCITAIAGDLTAQAYYLYARSSRAHGGVPRDWSGDIALCAKDRDFVLHLPAGIARCSADSYELAFAALATRHMRSWTATLRETPDLPSQEAAQRAGMKRLLADIGTRNLNSGKAADAALAQFRKRMRLANSAPAGALFDALETEAMKSAVPAGYTLCNDTAKPVWVAMGQKRGAIFSARGWWTVGGGTCSQLITNSIAGSPVYLRVEKAKGVPLVSGSETFCVTNIEFEVQGRGRCAQRGLVEAGFVPTNARGAPGFTAHVTERGLAPNGPLRAGSGF